MRRLIQNALRSRNIELRKAPAVPWSPVPVFVLAAEHLMHLRGDDLTFIQVGANDGVADDPIRDFITTRGWRGILCEPQADVFQKLKHNYAAQADRLIFENVAISADPGGLTLYRSPGADNTISSANPKTTAQQSGVPEADLVRVTVPTLTLDALIERHQIGRLDILQVDVEGYDFEVLKTLSLERYRPAVIQFEHGHLTPQAVSDVAAHLNAHGYLLNYGGRQSDSVAMDGALFGA